MAHEAIHAVFFSSLGTHTSFRFHNCAQLIGWLQPGAKLIQPDRRCYAARVSAVVKGG